MKLIHTLSAFDVFGPEKTVLNECEALARDGWDAEIVNFWNTEETPLAAKAAARGIPYTCIVSEGKFDASAIRALQRRIQNQGMPLVHSHGYKADLYSLIAARKAGAPVVTTVHGWTSENFKVRLYEKLQAALWRFFDRVYCVSESYCTVARGAGVSGGKVILVPNGIMMSYNSDMSPQSRVRARRDLGLPEEAVVVAIVGRLGIEKGHRFFVSSAAEVLKCHPATQFIIVGEGVERAGIEVLVAELGIQTSVHFMGHRHDMPTLYPAIDVLAITSLREGLPNVLLEAMLHAIPAVATAVGGIPDVVRDEEDGLLVLPGDARSFTEALARVVGDGELRQALGRRARQKILQNYLFDKRVAKVAKLYRDVMDVTADGRRA